MKVIIAGAGEVGFHLSKLLSNESHDIVLIDQRSEPLEYAESHFDIKTIKGEATSPSILLAAGIKKCDLLIAATSSETTNVTLAIMGKQMGAKRTIARSHDQEYLNYPELIDFKKVGIDSIFSPQELVAKEVKRLIEQAAFTDTFEFENGLLNIVGIQINEKSPFIDKTVSQTLELNPNFHFAPVAILRNKETLIPNANTVFELNDRVFFITLKEGISEVKALSSSKAEKIKNVMILGGSRTAIKVAKILQDDHSVKYVEENREVCEDLANVLSKSLLINGDGHNVDLLEEENIDLMDAFLGLSENAETNIMSCLVARAHGAKKTIALVENMDYLQLSQQLGVDALINKKLIAANYIFRYIRKGEVLSLASLHGVDAEILEFDVKEKSAITKKSVNEFNFPASATIAGLIRDGKPMITMGDFWIQPKDKVVVFCLPEAIKKVESFFQ